MANGGEQSPILLNQTAEYAMRALAYLAQAAVQGEGRVSSDELARETHIPSHYVSKVMRRLVVADLVDARRGRGGGFELARAPGEIRFIDVLEATDSMPDPMRCAFGFGQCDSTDPCPLHDSWSRLQEQFRTWAITTTLADVGPMGRH